MLLAILERLNLRKLVRQNKHQMLQERNKKRMFEEDFIFPWDFEIHYDDSFFGRVLGDDKYKLRFSKLPVEYRLDDVGLEFLLKDMFLKENTPGEVSYIDAFVETSEALKRDYLTYMNQKKKKIEEVHSVLAIVDCVSVKLFKRKLFTGASYWVIRSDGKKYEFTDADFPNLSP